MAPRQTNTREQIVSRGRDLLQCCGYDGFSYRDISNPLGIKNAAIHYHFPCKADLGEAILEEWLADIKQQIRHAREKGYSPQQQLEEFFRQSLAEAADGWKVCPFGALSINHEQLPDSMQDLMMDIRITVHEWLAANLKAGREDGSVHFKGCPEAKALEMAAAIQGARQISKVMERDMVTPVADQLRLELF